MNGVNARLNHTLFLKPKNYETSLNELRKDINAQRTGYIDVQLQLPFSPQDVRLQLKCTNLYIIGFSGKFGWYHFDDHETDGWGEPCGVTGNYPGEVPVTIDVSAVDQLSGLFYFKKDTKKDFNRELIVIAGAVVSESLRFDTVAKLFIALFDKKSVVPLGKLVNEYFKVWDKRSKENSPVDKVLVKAPESDSVASSSSS